MNTKPRTFHIDNQTFKRLESLAGLRKLSKSSFLRNLINERYLGDRIVKSLHNSHAYAQKGKDGVRL